MAPRMSWRMWSASRAILSAGALLVAPLFASCSSHSSAPDPSATGGAAGSAAATGGTGGSATGGGAGVSPSSIEAVCDTYGTGRAHVGRTCELGQVMVRGRLVRDLANGMAGLEPEQPWSAEDIQQGYQAAFVECTTSVSDFEGFGPCAPALLPVLACLGGALYVCIEGGADQANRWTTYDCNAQTDQLNQCLDASS